MANGADISQTGFALNPSANGPTHGRNVSPIKQCKSTREIFADVEVCYKSNRYFVSDSFLGLYPFHSEFGANGENQKIWNLHWWNSKFESLEFALVSTTELSSRRSTFDIILRDYDDIRKWYLELNRNILKT
ncbi:hypothetical protein CDAR_55871 [Caerostris darwini]|uniref:LAGLIDADG homing endonuclease n=1 Tax=Caerostris darwini TaxID=1538125 RepID=A0AAV4P6P3_9ARAC|nr:hypothetical protein CDAR_55871 [Caerostris darwini]